jgi:hypothetical protein
LEKKLFKSYKKKNPYGKLLRIAEQKKIMVNMIPTEMLTRHQLEILNQIIELSP